MLPWVGSSSIQAGLFQFSSYSSGWLYHIWRLESQSLSSQQHDWWNLCPVPQAPTCCFIYFSFLAFKSKSESHSGISDSLQPRGQYSLWNSLGQNTGVGSLSFLQRIFSTQGLNPALPHCRRILYQLSHKGSPGILEWIAYPFSSRSSRLSNQTRVSCIAGGFFNSWVIREAQLSTSFCLFVCLFVCLSFSHVWLFATPCTVAHKAPLSMGFSRQE